MSKANEGQSQTTMTQADIDKAVKHGVAEALRKDREDRAAKAALEAGRKVRDNAVMVAQKAKYGAGVVAGAAIVGAGLAYVVAKNLGRGIFMR